jgi:hypothetical protein
MDSMKSEHLQTLQSFLESLEGIKWFSNAGEPSSNAIVASDAVECWDDWNQEMLAVWLPRTQALEQMARAELGDPAIDEVFSAVSAAIDQGVRQGLETYFQRRPANSDNARTGADLGLWSEIVATVKRDVSCAPVEAIIGENGFFTEILNTYRIG